MSDFANSPSVVKGSSPPSDTNVVWIDTSRPVPIAKAHDGSAWVSAAVPGWDEVPESPLSPDANGEFTYTFDAATEQALVWFNDVQRGGSANPMEVRVNGVGTGYQFIGRDATETTSGSSWVLQDAGSFAGVTGPIFLGVNTDVPVMKNNTSVPNGHNIPVDAGSCTDATGLDSVRVFESSADLSGEVEVYIR